MLSYHCEVTFVISAIYVRSIQRPPIVLHLIIFSNLTFLVKHMRFFVKYAQCVLFRGFKRLKIQTRAAWNSVFTLPLNEGWSYTFSPCKCSHQAQLTLQWISRCSLLLVMASYGNELLFREDCITHIKANSCAPRPAPHCYGAHSLPKASQQKALSPSLSSINNQTS